MLRNGVNRTKSIAKNRVSKVVLKKATHEDCPNSRHVDIRKLMMWIRLGYKFPANSIFPLPSVAMQCYTCPFLISCLVEAAFVVLHILGLVHGSRTARAVSSRLDRYRRRVLCIGHNSSTENLHSSRAPTVQSADLYKEIDLSTSFSLWSVQSHVIVNVYLHGDTYSQQTICANILPKDLW